LSILALHKLVFWLSALTKAFWESQSLKPVLFTVGYSNQLSPFTNEAKTMNSELLIELSDEQQELVSGGGQLTDLSDSLGTNFSKENSLVQLEVGQTSGLNGSTNIQSFGQAFQEIDTSASKRLSAIFD